MKLAAIYNVWNDWDWMDLSVSCIYPMVDGIIVIGSVRSNSGEISLIPPRWFDDVMLYQRFEEKVQLIQYEPIPGFQPRVNEEGKRNCGLEIARQQGYTHFIMMDADEFYDQKQFAAEKQRFIDNPDLAGLVCASQVYFKSPKLTIGLDTTRVPFIHKITPNLRHEFNSLYPFAWEGKNIRIDPTRSLNINSGVEWSNIMCHHFSWVRKDYKIKIRNSTARANIERSTILQDLENAKDGYYCEFYKKTLKSCDDLFNIGEFLNET